MENYDPQPDPKIAQESREAYERGDYLTTEEILEEIASRKTLLEDMIFAAELADANDKHGISKLLYRAIGEITNLQETKGGAMNNEYCSQCNTQYDSDYQSCNCDNKMTKCRFCNSTTDMTGTKICNNCWEVTHRLQHMPLSVIRSILQFLENLTFNFDNDPPTIVKKPSFTVDKEKKLQ